MLTIPHARPARVQLHPLDRRGYYRSPITLPSYRQGQEPANKGRKFPVDVLSEREVLALVNACSNRGPSGLRNRALIVLMWRTGLRVNEALALQPRDVDLEGGRVHVRHGKGDKSRTVGIDPAACAVVQLWAEARRKLGAKPSQPLFCVISKPTIGEAMYSSYVRNLMKQAALKAGFDPSRRVHPHQLRHTHAYELFSEGFRLDYIQRQLGHNDLAVTARYIAHLNPADVVNAIRERTWSQT